MVRTQCFHCNDPGSIPGQATKLTRLLQLEKAQMQQWSLSTAKNEWIFKKIKKAPPAPQGGPESNCQCKGYKFDPWCRKIPYAAGQLSPCATTSEAQLP